MNNERIRECHCEWKLHVIMMPNNHFLDNCWAPGKWKKIRIYTCCPFPGIWLGQLPISTRVHRTCIGFLRGIITHLKCYSVNICGAQWESLGIQRYKSHEYATYGNWGSLIPEDMEMGDCGHPPYCLMKQNGWFLNTGGSEGESNKFSVKQVTSSWPPRAWPI